MTLRIAASEVRNRIGEILARVRYGGELILVERRGRPVAAILSVDEYRRLDEIRRQWEALQRRRRFAAIRASAAENDLTEEEAMRLLEEGL